MKCSLIKIIFIFVAMLLTSCVTNSPKSDIEAASKKTVLFTIDPAITEKFDMALIHIKAKEYDEAIVLLEQVIAEENRIPAPYINLAMAYEKKGDRRLAEKYFLQAVNVDLTHPVANNQLGLLYRKEGRFDEAKKAYTNALTKYPNNLSVLKNLGILCEIYMRDLPCALDQYEQYLSLQPDNKTMKIWVTDLSRRIK